MVNNPPGFVPIFGQGIVARGKQRGVSGGKSWLKSVKLHKYWPTFSHWSYEEIMELEESNFSFMVAKTGSSGVTAGARGLFLRLVRDLRRRRELLQRLPLALELSQIQPANVLAYLRNVVHTPLNSDPNDILPEIIVSAVIKVYNCLCRLQEPLYVQSNMEEICLRILHRPVLRLAARRLYNNMTLHELCWPDSILHGLGRERSYHRILERILRKRQVSGDSGFDESCDGWFKQTPIGESIWPVGENTVMFKVWNASSLQKCSDVERSTRHVFETDSSTSDEEFPPTAEHIGPHTGEYNKTYQTTIKFIHDMLDYS